jgi:hypothetical protein
MVPAFRVARFNGTAVKPVPGLAEMLFPIRCCDTIINTG